MSIPIIIIFFINCQQEVENCYFSEIAKRYIQETGKKALVLTHRIELCKQTSNMLCEFGVNNKIINSKVKELSDQADFTCFVAMVETLNNRLNDGLDISDVGLVIIDEAHYNSFRKLFKHFEKCIILGVTATPLSSNIKLPMYENYDELIVGNSINSLIEVVFCQKQQPTVLMLVCVLFGLVLMETTQFVLPKVVW